MPAILQRVESPVSSVRGLRSCDCATEEEQEDENAASLSLNNPQDTELMKTEVA